MWAKYRKPSPLKQLVASIVVALGFLWPAAATAAACLPRDVLVNNLRAVFQERQAVLGLASNGSLIEIFATEDGRTWTLVLTSPNKLSCVMLVGKTLMIIRQKDPKA